MEPADKQSLMHSENLSLPSFQVIEMTASLGCSRCRQRVSQVISKMTGLREYTVDVPNKQVMVKGDFKSCKKVKRFGSPKRHATLGCHQFKYLFKYFKPRCFNQIPEDKKFILQG